jgi:hypothetical protein
MGRLTLNAGFGAGFFFFFAGVGFNTPIASHSSSTRRLSRDLAARPGRCRTVLASSSTTTGSGLGGHPSNLHCPGAAGVPLIF